MVSPYYKGFQILRPLVVELDLETYYDIYDLSRSDRDEAEEFGSAEASDLEEFDSLKTLKTMLQKLHTLRKLFLCSLLALESDGGKSDFSRWAIATKTMSYLSDETAKMATCIDNVLREEEGQ